MKHWVKRDLKMSPTWHLTPNLSLESPRTQEEGEKGSAWEQRQTSLEEVKFFLTGPLPCFLRAGLSLSEQSHTIPLCWQKKAPHPEASGLTAEQRAGCQPSDGANLDQTEREKELVHLVLSLPVRLWVTQPHRASVPSLLKPDEAVCHLWPPPSFQFSVKIWQDPVGMFLCPWNNRIPWTELRLQCFCNVPFSFFPLRFWSNFLF